MNGTDTTGVIVVRAWLDGDGDNGLRAWITSMLDPDSGEEQLASATGLDAVCDEIRATLEQMLAGRNGA